MFSNRTSQKIFFVPPPYKHTTLLPGQPLTVQCGLSKRKSPEVESSRTSLASRTSSRTHFEVLDLGLEASSPWPWPRSLKSSKIALSSARGQHYFLNSWNFVGKRQKPRGNFANIFFVFLSWSIRVGKGRGADPHHNWNFTNDKIVTKKPTASSVSVSF